MAGTVSSHEHAHQLALRVQQLCALEQIYRELQASRQSPYSVFQHSKEGDLSDVVIFMLLLSMLYSVFDTQAGAVNLKELRPSSDEYEAEVSAVLERWRGVEGPIRRIRHNFAFHGSATKDGTANALKALQELGNDGVSSAYQLIEDLRQLYPWLALEALGGFVVPAAYLSKFRDVLEARRFAHEAVLEVRRKWSTDIPSEILESALSRADDVNRQWSSLRDGLSGEPRPGNLEAFLNVWTLHIEELRKTAESFENFQRTMQSAKETARTSAGTAGGGSHVWLRLSLTSLLNSLKLWKPIVKPQARYAKAFADVEESVTCFMEQLDSAPTEEGANQADVVGAQGPAGS